MPDRTFVIDCFPASAARYRDDHAIVAIDVIRATTLAVTAAASGRRCLIAADLDDAIRLRDSARGRDPGRRVGRPHAVRIRHEQQPGRSGRAPGCRTPAGDAVDVGDGADAGVRARRGGLRGLPQERVGDGTPCRPRHDRIAIIGAGSRGEFREEDQLGCAWLAARLMASGFRPADAASAAVAARWEHEPVSAIASGNSVGYLRRTDQLRDYDFIVERLDDVDDVCAIVGNETRSRPGRPSARHALGASETEAVVGAVRDLLGDGHRGRGGW